jgi:hypothetical protein
VHYSGTTPNNVQMSIGVFLGGKLEGAMQFGPSIDKRKLMGLVSGTQWNEFIELNRMAFTEALPRNSESRALSIAFRLMRKHAPHIKWCVSFADGTLCGDGAIYRASGFVLTQVIPNEGMWELPDDLARIAKSRTSHRIEVQCKSAAISHEIMRRTNGKNLTMQEYARRFGGRILPGFMLRYIYFLDPASRDRLTVPVLPFSEIERRGAGMYRGQPRADSVNSSTAGVQPDGGGANPTSALLATETEAADG